MSFGFGGLVVLSVRALAMSIPLSANAQALDAKRGSVVSCWETIVNVRKSTTTISADLVHFAVLLVAPLSDFRRKTARCCSGSTSRVAKRVLTGHSNAKYDNLALFSNGFTVNVSVSSFGAPVSHAVILLKSHMLSGCGITARRA